VGVVKCEFEAMESMFVVAMEGGGFLN